VPTIRSARPGRRRDLIGALVALAVVLAVATSVVRHVVDTATSSTAGVQAASHELVANAARPATKPTLPAPVRCAHCWHPAPKESWQIQLSSIPKAPFLKVAMIEVDGFDTPASTVAALHKSLRGRGVVCYIDAGTWENWRPDAKKFPKSLLGKPDGGWPGERWLDIAKFSGVLSRLMTARVQMCRDKGFDAVDFDNVDGYANPTGFDLTASDQLKYDVFLANTAHRLGLAVALKNDLPQIPTLLRYFDFAVNEQCFQYSECLSSQNGGFGLDEFIRAHKAVFEIEYQLKLSRFCPAAARDHFNSLRKHLNLGPWRQPCP
jgi:hypothetical protein